MELSEDDRHGVLDNQGSAELDAVLDDHINLEHHHQGHQLRVMPAGKGQKEIVEAENSHPMVS